MAVSRRALASGARHRVRGGHLRSRAVGRIQQLDPDRLGRPARRHAAGRRISLRAIHPRRAGARPRPRRWPRRCTSGRWFTAIRPPSPSAAASWRTARRSTPARGAPPRCCSTSPPPAPTSTIRRASPRGTRSSRPATARSRFPCRPTAATASSPTPSVCRPAPPPRSSSTDTDLSIGDLTITASANLTVAVESSPGVPVTYAELVLIPFDDPATTGAPVPSLYSLFAGCAPTVGSRMAARPRATAARGLLAHARPAGRRLARLQPRAHRQRQLRSGRPARALLRLCDARPVLEHRSRRRHARAGDVGAGQRCRSSRSPQLLPTGVVSGDFHVHGGASFDSAIPDQDRVVSFLATGVDVIIATDHNVVTSYAEHAGGARRDELHRRHPRRRADAQHPLVLRPRRHVPEDARPLQFLAADPRRSPDPQRRPLVRAARARPVDGRHGAWSSPTARRACVSSITRTCSPSWGATRATRKRSATTRPRRSRRRRPTASASPRTRWRAAPGGEAPTTTATSTGTSRR